jgi:hypothetical protein
MPRAVLLPIVIFCAVAFSWTDARACDRPPYPNSGTIVEGDLATTFSVDQFSYLLGQEVHTLLCVENVGSDTIRVTSDVSPLNAFMVMPDTCYAPE